MADITLSSAVRNNLLSLQNTSALLEDTQNNLATGLRVNSALDDPSAFFTASSLNSRAGDLNRLLDSVGLAIQTVEAADDGIGAITDLVEAAQASARNALQASGPTNTAGAAAGANTITDANIAATVTSTDPSITETAATVTGSGLSGAGAADLTDVSTGLANGDTIIIDVGGTTTTFTVQDTPAGTNQVDTLTSLVSAINDGTNGVAGVTADGSSGQLVLTADDASIDFTVSAGTLGEVNTAFGIAEQAYNSTNLLDVAGIADGNTLTIQVGSNAATNVTFGDGVGQVNTIAGLQAAINGNVAGAATATVSASGQFVLTATSNADDIAITGTVTDDTAFGFGSNDPTISPTAGTLLNNVGNGFSDGDQFSIAVGGTTTTLTIGTGAGQINSLTELDSQIDAIAGVSADVTGGVLTITNTDPNVAATLAEVTGTPLGDFGVATGAIANTAGGTANATRTAAETEFNNLLSQIDQLAADASFNGNNLLAGDNLTVIFNEDGSSSLAVTGVNFDSGGLGINAAATDAFQTDSNINTTLGELDTAISTLRTQAATFGSNLSVVQIRQDFTKNLINTLETGAGNLTLADSNLEAANLLALQTRQSLSSSSLSLAARADQNVLQLLR